MQSSRCHLLSWPACTEPAEGEVERWTTEFEFMKGFWESVLEWTTLVFQDLFIDFTILDCRQAGCEQWNVFGNVCFYGVIKVLMRSWKVGLRR